MDLVRLEPAHAPLYRALMLEAYALHPDAFTSSVEERAALPMSWWEGRLDANATAPELVIGALQDGALVGTVGVAFASREKLRHKATLFGMYVPSRLRGKGIGTRLVRAALAEAGTRAGVKIVQLTVTEGNHIARALYQKSGFVSFGLEPLAVAVKDHYVGKLHMWCELHPPRG